MSRTVSYLRILAWLFILGCAGATLVLSSFYLYLQPALPSVEQLRDLRLQTPLRIYSRDDQLIAEFGEKRRTPLAIEKVPARQIQAFMAAEDSRFWQHHGVDLRGLVRATYELVSTGVIQSGGSTITMQVAKNFFLSRDRTFLRKFNEILLALQIERELSKQAIMELYLNKIYLGNRAYGIEAAAQVYYGSSATDLSLAQTAMIAALPKAPSAINPLADAERALLRRNWILSRMRSLGYIDDKAYKKARSAEITASYHGPEVETRAPYIAEMVRREALARFGTEAYEKGYEIHTSIHSGRQNAARDALRDGLEAYDRRHGYRGPVREWDLSGSINTGALQERLAEIPQVHDLIPAVVTETTDEHATAQTAVHDEVVIPMKSMIWARRHINENARGPKPQSPSDVVSRGDVVYLRIPVQRILDANGKPRTLDARLMQIPEVQGAIVSLNPENGRIEALSGGYSFARSSFNRVVQAARQPGSAFKPLIFLAALEHGATPATTINDAPIVFDDRDLETTWRPENAGGQFRGPTRLRRGLYQSRNLVAIRLLRKTGIQKTLDYIDQLGVNAEELPRDLSLALGSGLLTPMEMTRTYAMIANGGYAVTPVLIETIRGPDNEIIYEAPETFKCDQCDADDEAFLDAVLPPVSPRAEGFTPKRMMPRVADRQTIYIMQSMMRDVIQRGTGRAARSLGRDDIAGKTGTTNDQRDTWFMGFNPDLAAGVWVGFDQPRSLGRGEYGSATALPIWKDYMAVALEGLPERVIDRPPGIVSRRIDPETGEPASTDNPDAVFEIFRAENAPEPVDETNDYREDGEDSGTDPGPAQQLF